MPRLPRSSKTIKALERLGFEIRQSSHVIMKQTSNSQVGCVVPIHKELKVGISGILRQARVSPEDFIDSL